VAAVLPSINQPSTPQPLPQAQGRLILTPKCSGGHPCLSWRAASCRPTRSVKPSGPCE